MRSNGEWDIILPLLDGDYCFDFIFVIMGHIIIWTDDYSLILEIFITKEGIFVFYLKLGVEAEDKFIYYEIHDLDVIAFNEDFLL